MTTEGTESVPTPQARLARLTGADARAAEPDAVGVDGALLQQAIGGWKGLIDSGVPVLAFVAVYGLNGQVMRPALIAAVAAGVVIVLLRLARRESLQQVGAGFLGLALSAFVASRTGRAEDFFLLGLLTNLAYGAAFLISTLLRWPLMGLLLGFLRGNATAWRSDPAFYRAAATVSWMWAAMFGLRLLVQVPLYWAGAVGALGLAKILMGWPLFLLVAYLSYRVLHPVIKDLDEREAEAAAVDG